jgi:hypothetical protein
MVDVLTVDGEGAVGAADSQPAINATRERSTIDFIWLV